MQSQIPALQFNQKAITYTHFLCFSSLVYYSKCTWLIWISLESIVTRCMVTVLALVITLVFSWYWCKLPFRSATDMKLNYLNPTEVNCVFVRQQCDAKLFKFIDWDCILFRLLWFNTFSCVYFVYCSWKHKAMFIVCFILILCFSCCVLQK